MHNTLFLSSVNLMLGGLFWYLNTSWHWGFKKTKHSFQGWSTYGKLMVGAGRHRAQSVFFSFFLVCLRYVFWLSEMIDHIGLPTNNLYLPCWESKYHWPFYGYSTFFLQFQGFVLVILDYVYDYMIQYMCH